MTKSISDIAYERLSARYPGGGSLSDLLRQFYADNPNSGKFGTQKFLEYTKLRGTAGTAHSDYLKSFWDAAGTIVSDNFAGMAPDEQLSGRVTNSYAGGTSLTWSGSNLLVRGNVDEWIVTSSTTAMCTVPIKATDIRIRFSVYRTSTSTYGVLFQGDQAATSNPPHMVMVRSSGNGNLEVLRWMAGTAGVLATVTTGPFTANVLTPAVLEVRSGLLSVWVNGVKLLTDVNIQEVPWSAPAGVGQYVGIRHTGMSGAVDNFIVEDLGNARIMSDSFNRADAASFTGNSDSTYGGATKTWWDQSFLQIRSNTIAKKGTNTGAWTVVTAEPNIYVYAKIAQMPHSFDVAGLMCRRNSTDYPNGYHRAQVHGDGTVTIVKWDGTNTTTLGTTSAGRAGLHDVIGIKASGNSIQALVDGVVVLSTTDNDMLNGNQAGVRITGSAMADTGAFDWVIMEKA